MRNYLIGFFAVLALSCSKYHQVETEVLLPACLQERIEALAKDPSEGSPVKVTLYTWQAQKVYYVVSPCCDKFNMVLDRQCQILGYPDGGYTGRGDGKMPDFFKEATDPKVVWELRKEE